MKHGANAVNDLGFLALPIGAVALSYFDTGASLLWASAAALAVAAVMARKAELFLTDWGVALALLYEMLSLAVSQYAANGLPFAKVVSSAAACYFLVPLSAATASRMAALSLLVGSGGAALAWRGLTQANEHAGVLRDNGFQDIVAFRARLISPPAPWVAGEWFTLLLMTLPFACALAAFCWLRWRRRWALAAVALPVPALAALLLSCSRAVFWAVIVLVVAAAGLAALYRVISLRAAVVIATVASCALGAVLFADDWLCPGIARAYTARQTSQVRSTQGRLEIWKRSADVFRAAPLWGVGSGNAPLFLTGSANPEETTGFASRTFSLPVQLLTEKGIVGTGLYVALLLLAARVVHRKLRSARTGNRGQ